MLESLAQELGVLGEPTSERFAMLGHKQTYDVFHVKNIILKSLDGEFQYVLTNVLTFPELPSFSHKDWSKFISDFPHLANLTIPQGSDGPIGILLGRQPGSGALVTPLETVKGKPGEPIAWLLNLGWSVMGTQPSKPPKTILPFKLSDSDLNHEEDCENKDNKETCISLRKLFEEDNLGVKHVQEYSANDRQVLKLFQQSFQNCNNQVYLSVPFNDQITSLPSNFQAAKGQLKGLVKSLKREAKYITYNNLLQQHEKLEYIQKVPLNCAKHFLPHFGVDSSSLTTPLRIVYNCSAKVGGKSLNDCMHLGPDFNNNLLDLLLSFRKNPIVVLGDIAHMYPKVRLYHEDKPYFCFLWESPDGDLITYQHQRWVFGSKSSPSGCQFVLLKIAELMKEVAPVGAELITSHRYMDDIVGTFADKELATRALKEASEIVERVGMTLHKLCSNEPEILSDFDQDMCVKQEVVKVLGILWDPVKDLVKLNRISVPPRMILTKRSLLHFMAKIYDPLGFFAPFTIVARELLQRTWVMGLKWDTELEGSLKNEVRKWLEQIESLTQVELPRLASETDQDLTIHIFCDSSEMAYGAVAYLVSKTDSVLLLAKGRVHTIKPLSMPRKELVAAVLAAKIAIVLRRQWPGVPVQLWTDSQNVVAWLQNPARVYVQYVAGRVDQIQTFTQPEEWNHVEGKRNAADIVSRGCNLADLRQNKLYWKGPDFLTDPNAAWPVKLKNLTVTSELKKNKVKEAFIAYIQPNWLPDLNIVSNLEEAVALTIRNLNLQGPDARRDAMKELIREVQLEHFESEVSLLKNKKPIPAKSKLRKLNIAIDEDGLIRCVTRLSNSDTLPDETKTPILLPKRARLTALIILSAHDVSNHCYGAAFVLSQLRTKYWIIAGRQAVKKVLRTCKTCQENFAKPQPPKMAPLPLPRVGEPLLAFWHVGVDYTGAVKTKQGRGQRRQKRYIVVFTCLQTRAIHLELAENLETDGFIQALERFVSKRGKIGHIFSDNGTNLRGGAREIAELVQQFDQQQINNFAETNGFIWHFSPPLSPHFGGVFESMVKAAKRAIRAILKNEEVTDIELITILNRAEDVINSRPLTYQSDDPNEHLPLTPNHFLHGRMDGNVFPPNSAQESHNPRKRWRHVEYLMDQFWKRWRKEYLPELGPRSKWFQDRREFEVGDEVLIADVTPRYKWKLGRVTQIHPGRDGVVRVVDLATEEGQVLQKSVHRLIPLT